MVANMGKNPPPWLLCKWICCITILPQVILRTSALVHWLNHIKTASLLAPWYLYYRNQFFQSNENAIVLELITLECVPNLTSPWCIGALPDL